MSDSPDNSGNEFGLQPLDRILEECHLTGHDLVAASKDQLTHKMVAKGRKGRLLSRNVQIKILNALNACQDQSVYDRKDLFTYKGK